MVMAGVGTAIEVGGLLWKVLQRVKSKQTLQITKPSTPAAAAEQVLETIHDSTDVAIVDVKSSWFNVDNLTRLMAFIAAMLALIFGHDVFSVQLQAAVVAILIAFQPLYEWWRSRRRTSITKAAAVNMLQKPKE